MKLSTVDLLKAASANRLGGMAADEPVTVEPTTPQQLPALRSLIESSRFQTLIAQSAQHDANRPAIAFHPTFQETLAAFRPLGLGTLGALETPSFSPSLSDLVGRAGLPSKTASDKEPHPAPKASADQLRTFTGSETGAMTNLTVAHVTTAKELQTYLAGQKSTDSFSTKRLAVGASAGAVVGLGFALVKQAVSGANPTGGALLDLGCMLIGAGLGGGTAIGLWEPSFDPKDLTFSLACAKP
jgi:hypothetical protein